MAMLLDTIGSLAADMNGINLATAFHRVAKLSNARGAHPKLQALKSDPRFVALCDDIFKHISGHSRLRGLGRSEAPGEMPVQCLSIVAWSCATLRISKQELFGQIAAMTAPNLGELKPYELSNLLWAYGKLHIGAPDLFVAAADRIRHRKEGEYKVQCLSTIAWCFATMHLRDAAIFRSIGKELALYPDEAKPQEISTTLWAFAKNRHASAPLFEAFGQAALKNGLIWQFKLQELSNTAWAFATAGLVNIELFEQIERAVLVKLPDMEPQSIANIMWALAKLQVPLHTDLFPKLLHITVSKQQQFKPQELSAVIWAAAQMCPDYATFFGAIMRTCVKRLTHFSANAIANMVKSLATVQTDEPNLYMAIVEESLERLPQLQPPALCNTLQGFTMAAACSTYAAQADVIGNAVSQVCQHLSARIAELKHDEIQQAFVAVRELRSTPNAAAEALQLALKERVCFKTSQPDCLDSEQSFDFSRKSSDDIEDMLWPTFTNYASSSCSATTAASEADLGFAVAELCEKASSAVPVHLGNLLASLANGSAENKKSKKIPSHEPIPMLLGGPWGFPQAPVPFQGCDSEPWKVPLPSCVPVAGGYPNAPLEMPARYGSNDAEAFMQASWYAMMAAAAISQTVAAPEQNGPASYSARMPLQPGRQTQARYG